jgi:transcriptional regulator with XRE-family HTH domain
MSSEAATNHRVMPIGKKIERIRMYQGIKQETLALALGISQQAVSNLEQQEIIDDELLEKVAKALGVTVFVIKNFDEEKAIFHINNIQNNTNTVTENTFEESSTINGLIGQQFNPYTSMLHMGRKVERIRRLRGLTQTELGTTLGITKQAVSKMEQAEKIEDEKLKQIADALGVTEEGLKNYNEEKVLYNTLNFYENCGVNSSSINANLETFNNFPIEKTIELFEKLLEKERMRFEQAKKGKK